MTWNNSGKDVSEDRTKYYILNRIVSLAACLNNTYEKKKERKEYNLSDFPYSLTSSNNCSSETTSILVMNKPILYCEDYKLAFGISIFPLTKSA